jgi:hypothetical protein
MLAEEGPGREPRPTARRSAAAPRHDQQRLGSVPSVVPAGEDSDPFLLSECCAARRCPGVEKKNHYYAIGSAGSQAVLGLLQPLCSTDSK